MNTLLRTSACLLSAFVCASAAAQSAGPTFTVPVDLKNLHPALTRGRSACYINPANATTASDLVAGGNVEFAITNQAFKGDVAVRTTDAPGKTSALASKWHCRVEVFVSNQWHLLGGNSNLPETNAAANTLSKTIVEGSY